MANLGHIRAFICFKLPERIISSICRLQKSMQNSGLQVRWVRPENIHLTIKFLGNIRVSDINDIEIAVQETAANFSPLLLSAGGSGVFPNIRKPRVIWTGIEGQRKELVDLQKMLADKLECIGFPKETRPFKGHLTIGRLKGRVDSRKLAENISRFNSFTTKQFSCDRIFLMQSELKPSGPIYSRLMSEPLG
jgi:2'-5' RNA ligase